MPSLLRDWPRWWSGEGLVLVLFIGLALSYVVFLPSFEGPDESEHARYVQAWVEGGEVHPVDPEQPRRWGYQVHHPLLYYALASVPARLLGVTFHDSLVINPLQNARFPFLRHDGPEQGFPYDDVHRGLHALRLLSVLLGVLTFLVLERGFRMLFPGEPATRTFLLAASMLAPNTLQLFSIVANDALNMLFSSSLLALAIAILRDPRPGLGIFVLAGACAGLATISKLTGLAALAVAGSAWGVDALVNRRVGTYLRGMIGFLPPLLVVAGPFFATNVYWYGDLTRESLMLQLTPTFHLDAARPILEVVGLINDYLPFQFAANLGWQSVQLPELGTLLLSPWLMGVVFSAGLVWRREERETRIPAERLIPLIALLWSVILLVAANREWTNLQVRHVWCLYPFTLISVAYVLQLLPAKAREWGRAAATVALVGLLMLNAQVLVLFQSFYEPHASSRMDRDYYSYLYTLVTDRNRGERYLRYGR